MFLQLNHQKLTVFITAKKLALECYKVTRIFPADEKFNMVQQIRRAALSIVLNIAEGASRKSEAERKRFFEISRGSLIEIDAALDIANELGYLENYNIETLGSLVTQTFATLTGLLKNKE